MPTTTSPCLTSFFTSWACVRWAVLTVLVVCTSCTPQDAPESGANGTSSTGSGAVDAAEPKSSKPQGPNDVLRHAVFFKYKDTSSEEDVQGVADAFRALPAKIDAIIDFQWGKNNSPEGLDDGFTHCFFLTFKDTAGREAYIPHADHSAFGDVLRPHSEDVFVIDYWGTPQKSPLEKELKHAVFFKFKDDAAAEDIKAVEEAFAELPAKIDTIKAFEWGTNNSPEGKDDGFTHCFMVSFDTEEGRQTYLDHDDHLMFVELLKPVLDKARVLDFWGEK